MLEAIIDSTSSFVFASPENRIGPDDAMREDLVGLQLFDAPIFAIGDAADLLFARLKEPGVVHPDLLLPDDWLAGARRVISYFLPFTRAVKTANAADLSRPCDEWLHGRIEGQMFISQLGKYICAQLRAAGYAAVAPGVDERIKMLGPFASNWSERHAGFICGLGTFSLSKGLITAKGVAGRIGSVITDCELPVTTRAYIGLYEYCNFCGKCEANCPVDAIDSSRGMDRAKAHPPCKTFLDEMLSQSPRGKSQRRRYGCGKCQVDTPCQDGIPLR